MRLLILQAAIHFNTAQCACAGRLVVLSVCLPNSMKIQICMVPIHVYLIQKRGNRVLRGVFKVMVVWLHSRVHYFLVTARVPHSRMDKGNNNNYFPLT